MVEMIYHTDIKCLTINKCMVHVSIDIYERIFIAIEINQKFGCTIFFPFLLVLNIVILILSCNFAPKLR
jgi:hypothetical protein